MAPGGAYAIRPYTGTRLNKPTIQRAAGPNASTNQQGRKAPTHKRINNMKYIILQRANPQDRRKAKWYATPLLERRVRQAELTSQLTETLGIRYGIVRKIIQVFLEAVVRHLLSGRSVCLRPLGTLRISFTSDGMEEPEHVTPDMIRDLKIVITPDKLLKEQLSNLHFELHEDPAASSSPHESVVEMMPRAYPRVSADTGEFGRGRLRTPANLAGYPNARTRRT